MLARSPDLRLFLLLLFAGSLLMLIGRALMIVGYGGLGLLVGGPGVLLAGVLFWCLAFHSAPRFTRQATAVALSSILLLSLLACWIDHSRDQARRQQVTNHLRQLGMSLQEQTRFSPAPERQRPSWASQLPQLDTQFVNDQPTYQLPAP